MWELNDAGIINCFFKVWVMFGTEVDKNQFRPVRDSGMKEKTQLEE